MTSAAAPVAAQTPIPPITPTGFKDVGVAYILLVIFGFLGVHKFYLGRVGFGILYIFTGGILGIGLIVDLFTLSNQVRRANLQIRGY